jgi:hypothetical protein
MPTLFKFLKSLLQKLRFLKKGNRNLKPIFLIVKIRSMTAENFFRVEVLILNLFATVRDFADFSSSYRSSTHQPLSV